MIYTYITLVCDLCLRPKPSLTPEGLCDACDHQPLTLCVGCGETMTEAEFSRHRCDC